MRRFVIIILYCSEKVKFLIPIPETTVDKTNGINAVCHRWTSSPYDTQPVISYNYGAKCTNELKRVLKKSLVIIGVSAILLTLSAKLLSPALSGIFVSYDKGLYELTKRAFSIYSISFLFSGFAIYASSFFTALGNGLVSAIISFLRTCVFQIACVLLLPLFLSFRPLLLLQLPLCPRLLPPF